MMMGDAKGTYLTRDGLRKLEEELQDLKNVRRREIAERINQAKELGDLSENAEYVEAKTEQAFVEGRILVLENMIHNAVVIDESKHSDFVEIGSGIEVKANGTTHRFTIVGSNEVDPSHGKISNESPLGKAFLGKRAGDRITVNTPTGTKDYTVIRVS